MDTPSVRSLTIVFISAMCPIAALIVGALIARVTTDSISAATYIMVGCTIVGTFVGGYAAATLSRR